MNAKSVVGCARASRSARGCIWALAVAAAVQLSGCPLEPVPIIFEDLMERPGNLGLQTRGFGEEAMVTLDAGNLILTRPATPDDRAAALGAFLQEYREFFGGAAVVKANVLDFAPATPEQDVLRNGVRRQQTVMLYQEHEGALVLDNVLCGVFEEDGGKAGSALRRARGHLLPTDTLPSPPAFTEGNMLATEHAFAAFLAQRGTRGGVTSYFETPVILAEKNVAGYLASYAEPKVEEARGIVYAVVDPLAGMVVVLRDVPACQAHAR